MSMKDRLKDLVITEENDKGFEFSDLGGEQLTVNYDHCLVGTLLLIGH